MFYKNKIIKDDLILFCVARGTRDICIRKSKTTIVKGMLRDVSVTKRDIGVIPLENILRIFKAMPSHRQDLLVFVDVQCGASAVATVC